MRRKAGYYSMIKQPSQIIQVEFDKETDEDIAVRNSNVSSSTEESKNNHLDY